MSTIVLPVTVDEVAVIEEELTATSLVAAAVLVVVVVADEFEVDGLVKEVVANVSDALESDNVEDPVAVKELLLLLLSTLAPRFR